MLLKFWKVGCYDCSVFDLKKEGKRFVKREKKPPKLSDFRNNSYRMHWRGKRIGHCKIRIRKI